MPLAESFIDRIPAVVSNDAFGASWENSHKVPTQAQIWAAGFSGGAADPTLAAFGALTITANSLTIGTGADAFSQVAFAANTFPARASTGDLEAKTISDNGLSFVGAADYPAMRTLLGIDADDAVTFGDLTVNNLVVNGTSTTLNTVTLSVDDPLIKLADGNAADSLDVGFYGLYVSGGSKYSGLFRDATDGKYRLFTGLEEEPTTTVNVAGTGYAIATIVANFESANVAFTGGTITGITDLAIADGGTGASTALGARTNLGLEPVWGAINQTEYLDSYASLAAFKTAVGSTPVTLRVTSLYTLTDADVATPLPATVLLTTDGDGGFTATGSVKTFIIGAMRDPGPKQIFFGSSLVAYFAKNAVPEFDISWWAGVTAPATDVTAAFEQAGMSISANNGGRLRVGGGVWLISEWDTPIYNFTVQGAGRGMTALEGTVLRIFNQTEIGGAYVVKISEAHRNIKFRDLTISVGTSSTARCLIVEGTPENSAFNFQAESVRFHGTGSGAPSQVYFHSTSGAWETINNLFVHCAWATPSNSKAWESDTINTSFKFIQPMFELGVGATALKVTSAGFVEVNSYDCRGSVQLSPTDTLHRTITQASIVSGTNALSISTGSFVDNDHGQKVTIAGKLDSRIIAVLSPTTATVANNATGTAVNESMSVYRTTPNSGMASCLLHLAGDHGPINLTGGADEGLQYLIINDVSDLRGPVNLMGNQIQSRIKANAAMALNLYGNNMFSGTLVDASGILMRVNAVGNAVIKENLNGLILAKPRLWDQHDGVSIIQTEFDVDEDNYIQTFGMPTVFTHRLDIGSATDPMVGIGSTSATPGKNLFRLGTKNPVTELWEYYYDFSRESDGYLYITGNQSGFRGINLNGPMVATAFSGGAWNGSAIGVTYGGTGTTTQFTPSAVVFAGTSGVYNQDAAFFKWDATNHRLGIGVGGNTPARRLEISADEAFQLRIGNSNDGASPTLTYDIGRSNVDGFLYFYGNQSGAVGYVFSGVNGEFARMTAAGTTVGNLTVNNNLIVNGDAFDVFTASMAVEDPLVKFATGNAADSLDIGFYGLYNSGGAKYTGLFRDASDGKYRLFTGLQSEPTTTVNIAGAGYAVGTLVVNIESANVAITGGTIAGITDLAIADGGTGASSAAGARANLELGSIALLNSISNSNINPGVDAVKIADGSVTNAEFQFINSLTSNAQTQLDARVAKARTVTAASGSVSPAAAASGTEYRLTGGSVNLPASAGCTAGETVFYVTEISSATLVFTANGSDVIDFWNTTDLTANSSNEAGIYKWATAEIRYMAAGKWSLRCAGTYGP